MFKEGYYYLHANDQIIWKPKIVVEMDPMYFCSRYVIKYWKVETESQYNDMIDEAKKLIAGV